MDGLLPLDQDYLRLKQRWEDARTCDEKVRAQLRRRQRTRVTCDRSWSIGSGGGRIKVIGIA